MNTTRVSPPPFGTSSLCGNYLVCYSIAGIDVPRCYKSHETLGGAEACVKRMQAYHDKLSSNRNYFILVRGLVTFV